MKCRKCESERLAEVKGKCSNNCLVKFAGFETEGSIPEDLGIGGGEYLRFDICLNCGQMQGEFPTPPSYLEKDLPDTDIVSWFDSFFSEGDRIKPGLDLADAALEDAKVLHPKFAKFIGDLFDSVSVSDIKSNGKKTFKFPPIKKFIKMYKENDLSIDEL